jgi:hypothetical protein
MEPVLSSVSAPELQPAMDANLAAYWAEYGRAKGCAMQQSPDVLWFYTGVSHPLFNGVQAAALKVSDGQRVLECLGAHIAARDAPAMWWIGARSNPDALQSLLEQHGLEPPGEIPGMAHDLTQFLES